jgi:pimeloyl-ACP methyl ester carboxylesterase
MPYFAIPGLRLFYKDVGRGAPLVLIPGLGADSMAFNPVLPDLRKRVRVIAPDPRGLGRSGDAIGPLSTRQLTQDIRELLDHLEIRRVAILGASMGALVVRRFATQCPDRVDRVILCTAGRGVEPYARRVGHLIRALVQGAKPDDLMAHFLTLILSPRFIDDHPEWVWDLARFLRPDERTVRTMERQLEMMEAEAGEEMGPIHAPVLILAGAQDRLVPLHHAEALQQSMPGSRLVVLAEAAHHPFLEAREETLEAVMAFLEEGR